MSKQEAYLITKRNLTPKLYDKIDNFYM